MAEAIPVFMSVVGGTDFPKICIGEGGILTKCFVFNNLELDASQNVKLFFQEERVEQILADGYLKRYRKGFRFYCEIPFQALKQLSSELDQFLVELHNAIKIVVYPHKDHNWNDFEVIIDNDWDYNYWLNKPYLGWQGTIKLKGVKRLDRIPLESILTV